MKKLLLNNYVVPFLLCVVGFLYYIAMSYCKKNFQLITKIAIHNDEKKILNEVIKEVNEQGTFFLKNKSL